MNGSGQNTFSMLAPKNSFLSKVQRFNSKNDKIPGPGSYDLETSAKTKSGSKTMMQSLSDSNFTVLKMQSPPSIPSHEHVFGYEEARKGMLVKQTNPDDTHKGEKGDTIGPGQYDIAGTFGSSRKPKGVDWQRSKSKRDIFKNDNDGGDIGGAAVSTFSSKISRKPAITKNVRKEFMKRMTMTAPKKPNDFYNTDDSSDDDKGPGPGYYYNQSALSEFSKDPYTGKNQFFGSTVERFQPPKDNTIGPGVYTVNSGFNVSKARMASIKKSPVTTRERFKNMYNTEVPGPGQYNQINMTDQISKKTCGKKGIFGTTNGIHSDKKLTKSQSQYPGPGAYKPEASLKMLDNKKNSSIKRVSSMFLSSTVREPNKVKKLSNPSPSPGNYDQDYNSISHSVKRKIESGLGNPLLASLKAKSTIVAPFNSCLGRFNTRKAKDHEKFLGPGYYEFKTFVETNKPKSINPQFLSSEQRFSKASQGGKAKINEPGPGKYEYDLDDPWNKRSYNITYED